VFGTLVIEPEVSL